MYILEDTMHNFVNFVFSTPIDSIVLFTDMQDRAIFSTTFGHFLDWVPDQKLVPTLQEYFIPYQIGEKKVDSSLLAEAKDANAEEIMQWSYGSDESE